MTQAERTRTIKYVLDESRWLLHRRRNTKKINILGGMQEKTIKKIKKKSRKQGTKARKSYPSRLHSNTSSRLY